MTEGFGGVPLSVEGPAGARWLAAAVESYLASRSDTPVLLKQALQEDPGHIMARCMMGYLCRLAGDPANAARASSAFDSLRGAVAAGAGTGWERRHVSALGLWVDDDLQALMAHFESILDDHPGDVLSLRMLHYLYFYDGDAGRMRDSLRARMDHYAGDPLESYLHGMLAFALEESGDYAAAETHGRRAVEERPDDIWAAHAVAHVMQMQGRFAEGARWIEALRPHWQQANNFRFHLYWHEALHHLGQGDRDRALAIYDTEVAPPVAEDFYLDLCNAASLLLRLEALGCDVGQRWQPLAAIAERHSGDTELVFASLHYLMPLLRTGHPAAADLLAGLRQWAGRRTDQARVVRDVALQAAEFLVDVEAGAPERASSRFEALRPSLHRIGGSHAQRELFAILYHSQSPPEQRARQTRAPTSG